MLSGVIPSEVRDLLSSSQPGRSLVASLLGMTDGQAYGRDGISMMGRTSIEPVRAEGMRAASAVASSRSFASTM